MTFGFARLCRHASPTARRSSSRPACIAGSLFGGMLALVGQKAWQPAAERLDRAFFRGLYDARRLLQTLADQSRLATDRAALAELIDHVGDAGTASEVAARVPPRRRRRESHRGGARRRCPATPRACRPRTAQLMELTRRGRPVLIDPAQLGPGGPWQRFAALAPEALVPLVGRSGQIEGLLVLGPRLSEEPYSGEDVALLASVGTQAGLALENIRLAETMAARLEAERRARARAGDRARRAVEAAAAGSAAVSTLDYAGACLQARVGWRRFLRLRRRWPRAVRRSCWPTSRGRGFRRRC